MEVGTGVQRMWLGQYVDTEEVLFLNLWARGGDCYILVVDYERLTLRR